LSPGICIVLDIVVRWGDVVTRYLHCIGPGGRDDLHVVTLVIGQGNRGHGVDRGGNVLV
jgi:hypothetical protein